MSQVIESEQLKMLLRHLSGSSRDYLKLAQKLEALPPESNEADELLGKMYAYVQQVHMDTEDVIEAMDTYADTLPDDGNET